MNRSSVHFEPKYTPFFEGQLKKLQKKDKIRTKRILKKVKDICASPYDDIKFATGRYKGKREARVGNDRLLYIVCEQCRDLQHMNFNGCRECNQIKDETVIFVMIIKGHKY